MPSQFYVKIMQNRELASAAIKRIKELGYKWGSSGCDDHLSTYGYFMWDDGTICYSYSGNFNDCGELVTIDDLLFTDKCKFSRSVEVQLNNEYSAEITKEGIKVGCQSFSFAKLDELVVAASKFRVYKKGDIVGYDIAKTLPVGTKVKIIKGEMGGNGCEGATGTINAIGSTSTNGKLKRDRPDGIIVQLANSPDIWNIGTDDISLEIL